MNMGWGTTTGTGGLTIGLAIVATTICFLGGVFGGKTTSLIAEWRLVLVAGLPLAVRQLVQWLMW